MDAQSSPKPDATVDGIKHLECWLLSCRVCGPIGVANTVASAHIEARAHLQVHGVTTDLEPGE